MDASQNAKWPNGTLVAEFPLVAAGITVYQEVPYRIVREDSLASKRLPSIFRGLQEVVNDDYRCMLAECFYFLL